MNYELLYIVGVLTSSALGVAVTAWLYSDDAAVSTRLYVGVVAVHAVVGLLVVGQLLAPDSLVVPIYGVQKAVAAGIMPLWFLFALAYTRQQNGISRRTLSVIGGHYILIALLEVTNPLHGLLRSGYETTGTLIPHLVGQTTLLYSIITLPLALFYFAGLGLVGVHALSGPTVSRRQSAYLFAGYLPPFFVLMAGIYEVLPGPVDGGLVMVSTLSLGAVGWAVFRHRLFDLIPLARETVFETIDVAVIVVDDKLRLLDYNEATTELFPQLDGAQGAVLADLIPALVSGDETDDPFARSFTHDHDDGPRHYEVTVSNLQVGGETRGYGVVARDVTERKERIRQVERERDRLDEFAGVISHDLRNPLNVAQGRLDLAIEDCESEHHDHIARAHDRMETLIDDVLSLARAGVAVGETQSVDLADLVENCWRNVETPSAHIVSETNGTVRADKTRLEQLFENLFRNAVEHAGEDVTVTVGKLNDGFYVEDDGPGIPDEDRESILDAGHSTAEEGTGFGLSIVRGITEAHGWEIDVTDGSDGGARFEFTGVQING